MWTGQSPDSFCRWDNVKKIFNSHSEAGDSSDDSWERRWDGIEARV